MEHLKIAKKNLILVLHDNLLRFIPQTTAQSEASNLWKELSSELCLRRPQL